MSRIIDSFPEWFTRGIFTRLGTLFPEELPWANENGQTLDQMYFGNHSGDKETSPLLDKFIEQNRGNDIPEALTEEQVTTLANILYTRYGVQWDKLYKVLSAEYNPIENYSMTEEETPDITRTETPDITRTETPDITRTETPDITIGRTTSTQSDITVTTESDSTNDIYGFNSTAPVPSGASEISSTVNTQGDADNNVTTENETETGTRNITETGTRTETETGTRTERETGKRTLTRSGNIGVTTSQQMLESEIKLWEWNFYETVFKDVDTVLTVPKYNFYYRRFLHND
jgi:hypothetical protein